MITNNHPFKTKHLTSTGSICSVTVDSFLESDSTFVTSNLEGRLCFNTASSGVSLGVEVVGPEVTGVVATVGGVPGGESDWGVPGSEAASPGKENTCFWLSVTSAWLK